MVTKLFFIIIGIVVINTTIYSQQNNYIVTDKVHIRFVDINLVDFEVFKQEYGFSLEYCILDGLCSFVSDHNITQQELQELRKGGNNIQEIRYHKKFLLKPY
jgi:hypothetical protein